MVLVALAGSALNCASGTETTGMGGSGSAQAGAGMTPGTAGAGTTGVAGTGTTGVAGTGTTGAAGTTGVAGTGTTGVAGTTGAAGTGTTGVAGTTGASGRGGSTGAAGTTGVAGRGGSTGTGGTGPACAGTLMRCNGACVDTTGSMTNCGMCGNACRSDMQCWQSACRCATGMADCGGVCKDVQSTATNCGTCNNVCATGATCVMGVCTCPTGQTACSGTCRNLTTDNSNCGTCGTVCSGGTMCLFGGCLDPSSLACSPAARANQSSARDATIILGKYWINNNWWGAANATGSQSIWSTCQQGDLIGWGTSYNWSGTSNQVKTFASAVFGWHWGWKVTNTGLPVQISSGRRINCGWDFTHTHGTGSADVAYDIWLHSIPMAGTNDDPTDEVMIWLERLNGAGPIGARQATVTIGGTSWDLHRGAITDSSGRTRWNVFSFIRTANATTAVLNIMDFMNDLSTRGWVASSKYVSSIQAGTEIFTGTGELNTRGFYCRIQ